MCIESLKKAVVYLGGQTATAAALSIGRKKPLTQAHIYKWLNSPNPDMSPPAEYCPLLERVTDRVVTCEQLRPDVDWATVRTCICKDSAA